MSSILKVRQFIGNAFYVLAAVALVYMMVGCGVTLVRDVKQDGLLVTVLEHTWPPWVFVVTSLLWAAPAIILLAIGRIIKGGDRQGHRSVPFKVRAASRQASKHH